MPLTSRLLAITLASLALAASGCGDDTETTPVTPPPDPTDPQNVVPAPGGLRRLTASQFLGSIKVVLGDAAAAAASPPDDASALGLKVIAAAENSISAPEVETYELAARRAAAAAVADPGAYAGLVPCTPSGPTDAACFGQVARSVARVAWRRTLTEDEVTTLVTAATTAATSYGSFEAGVESLFSATLQSPDFLYQVEIGEPDPTNPARRRLLGTELASRMSFFLLGRGPDKALLDRAEAGAFADEAAIRQLATELIARPEARDALAGFYAEVFDFDDPASLQKDPAMFPLFTDATRAAVAEETRLFLDDIVWTRNADAREMYDASFTYVNQDNAWLYGIAVTGTDFQRVDLAGRSGLLTQPALLARHAHPGMTSPTRRGLFIITNLLCGAIPPPPPGVNPSFPPDDGQPKTMKQRLELHATDSSCAQCHARMDPLGLSMEFFDAVGAARQNDNGLPIDPAGSTSDLGSFSGVSDVGRLLRENASAQVCMARFLYRQSMGHIETEGEAGALTAIDEAFTAGGYRVQQLMAEIASSPAFRLVGEPK